MTKEQMLKIIKAIKIGDIPYIAELLAGNTDWLLMNLLDDKGTEYLAVHYACRYGRLEVVQLLLEKKPDLLDARTSFNQTPICFAAKYGHKHVVEYLVPRGVNLYTATNNPGTRGDGFLPIHWAVDQGWIYVIEYLIEQGVDFNIRLGEKQRHLIHIASRAGQLEVIKFLLNKDPALLNIMDAYGESSMILAAQSGRTDVVAYLISINANLDLATNRPGHVHHGKTALTYAMDCQYYGVANLIILKICEDKSTDSILPFVQTARQAIDLMVLHPVVVGFFLRDERIVSLLNREGLNTKEPIGFYGFTERRPSCFFHIDETMWTPALFKPIKKLGEGTYGQVRLFESAEGKKIAVKSFEDEVIDPLRDNSRLIERKIAREAQFNIRAYPLDKFSKSFVVYREKSDQKIFSSRYIMDFVKGETAHLLLPKTTCPRELAKITLLIAQELRRIHNIGIIHGDLNPNNMMIHRSEFNTFTVRLIDFGFSYDMTEDSAPLYMSKKPRSYYPPELFNDKGEAVKPHPNQDIYSLGYSLHWVFSRHASKDELMRLFPCIKNFIVAAKDINPKARPSLESFCKEFHEALYPKIERAALLSPETTSVMHH